MFQSWRLCFYCVLQSGGVCASGFQLLIGNKLPQLMILITGCLTGEERKKTEEVPSAAF